MRSIKLGLALALATGPALAETPAYAGQQARAVKSLSAQEVGDLLAGRGMGLAKAAELNHYPGPMHALELRDALALTSDQTRTVEAIFARMRDAARPLGARIVEHEATLDRRFAVGRITPDELRAGSAAMQGELRAVHLAAHLETRAALTPEQVARYDVLRGYGEPSPAGGHAHRHG